MKLVWLIAKLIVATLCNGSVELLLVIVLGFCWVIHKPIGAFAEKFLDWLEPVVNASERWLENVKEQVRDFD